MNYPDLDKKAKAGLKDMRRALLEET